MKKAPRKIGVGSGGGGGGRPAGLPMSGPVNPAAALRTAAARRSTRTPAAAAAAARCSYAKVGPAATKKGAKGDGKADAASPASAAAAGAGSLVCAMSYRGMEVIFASLPPSSESGTALLSGVPSNGSPLVAVFARTRAPFQTLDLPPESARAGVVALTGHPATGLVCAATADGRVHTYHPAQAIPASDSDGRDSCNEENVVPRRPVTVFGRYRWRTGRVAECGEVFSHETQAAGVGGEESATASTATFHRKLPLNGPSGGENDDPGGGTSSAGGDRSYEERGHVCISTSLDQKVLVAHRDQLAVFDAAPAPGKFRSADDAPRAERVLVPPPAELLWTARVHATVLHASIAGDGRSFAYVLAGEGEGVPYPYGARTYVRDHDDGSSLIPSAALAGKTPKSPSTKEIDRSVTNSSFRKEKDSKGGGLHMPSYGMALPATAQHSSGGLHGIEEPPLPRQAKYDWPSRTPDSGVGAVGILYKPGPFLVHSAPVTRLSFRGFGHNHSSQYAQDRYRPNGDSLHECLLYGIEGEDEEGNDLLLTCCDSDGSCRVFSQNSWRQLMHWTAPPGSRADWVEGISAANLGDLDAYPQRKKGRQSHSSSISRSGSGEISEGGGINRHLLHGGNALAAIPAHPAPSSSAGAWIAEVTFQGPFPVLRLSRLSYLKSGGDDAAPAHFESVAAVLPPGIIQSRAVLGRCVASVANAAGNGPTAAASALETVGCGEESSSMCVQGIWPVWDPWENHPSAGSAVDGGNRGDEGLSGNARALLGVSSFGGVGASGYPGAAGYAPGGTHSPPSELRIVSGHIVPGRVIIMEFPLWGDKDFGAMELGSPLRYQLALSDEDCQLHGAGANDTDGEVETELVRAAELPPSKKRTSRIDVRTPSESQPVCLDFESSRLCASISKDQERILLLWRKQGTMNILATRDYVCDGSNLPRVPSLESIASSVSVDSEFSHHSYYNTFAGSEDDKENHDNHMRKFVDVSVVPAPISLPSLRLTSASGDRIILTGGGQMKKIVFPPG